MDALEFLKEERRMCNSFDIGCVKCPLGDILDVALVQKKRMKSLRKKLSSLSNGQKSTRARRGRACFWSSSQTSGLT
jgi:hypothetical protein